MKILVTYYSRTKITQKVAKEIQKNLNCDIEEIIDIKNRSGIIGYIKSAYEAIRSIATEIKPVKKDPSEYDLIIIGTPVWASTITPAILTYLTENKAKFKEVSFFCTCGSGGYNKTLNKMKEVSGKEAVETLFITKKDVESSFNSKIQLYTEKLKQS